MSKHWEYIAECLRAELADYGGLLHLFEAQQRSLCGRAVALTSVLSVGGNRDYSDEREDHQDHHELDQGDTVNAMPTHSSRASTS